MVKSFHITPDFFQRLCHINEFREILGALDIPDEEQLDLFETLDIDGGGTLDLDELVQGVHKLRGDARRGDIVSVSLMVRAVQEDVQNLQSSMMEQFDATTDRVLNQLAVQRQQQ